MCSHVTCLIDNWAAVSRNRYGVEKAVDTHKILKVMIRQFKEKNKNLLRLKLKSALKIEQISVVL
jgi:FtsZ-binding cell division protein ZapB